MNGNKQFLAYTYAYNLCYFYLAMYYAIYTIFEAIYLINKVNK